MSDMEMLREGVRKSLPEVEMIKDEDLRKKVIDAWALALSETEYERIEDMSSAGVPGSPEHIRHSQADHLRGTALIALGMAEQAEKVLGPLGIDPDIVIAGGLLHDVGKPYEFSARNQQRWQENTARYGWPAFRHSGYGLHICLMAGLPEEIAHIAGYHSGGGEGEWIKRSLIGHLVADADLAYWHIVDRAGLLESPLFDPATTIIKLGTLKAEK
jgi:putative nucleotidyltransferase with HDIG domain